MSAPKSYQSYPSYIPASRFFSTFPLAVAFYGVDRMSLLNLANLFSVSDEQLMWRVRMTDDGEAFGQLVGRWQGAIQRLCTRMVGDSHKAEDLAQEAFVRIYGHRREYQAAAKFSTYLWRVALNVCYDELRRLKRRPEVGLEVDGFSVLDGLASADSGPDTALEGAEQAEMVRQALLKLPEHYRAVVALKHYEGLKFREIATVLEIPEGTVKSRMAEGLEQLETILSRALRAEADPLPPAARRRESLIL